MSRGVAVTAAVHTEVMSRSGCPPQRHQRAADTLELWDTRGSADIVDWRRARTAAESGLLVQRGLRRALGEVNRRLPAGEAPHVAPRQVRWLPLRLDAAAAGWPWGLVVDDRLLLPVRAAARWIEQGAPPPQAERAGTWWRIVCPDDQHWAWFVAASTLEVAVRRALHAAAPIPTAVHVTRSQIRHDLLVAVVDATPPGRPTVRLVAQDLGGRNGPNGGWGCCLADDLDDAPALCG